MLLDPALPLPNTVQQEMSQFEEAERKKRRQLEEDLNRARNLLNTPEEAELCLPAGPLGSVIVPFAITVLPELSHGICRMGRGLM